MNSPPKRVTRARAAAKNTDKDATAGAGVKTTKIATAASRARTARTASTATKRKTRADDSPDESQQHRHDENEHEPEPIIEPEQTAAKTTRGRPRRTPVVQKEEMETKEKPVPKTTRGRATSAAVQPKLEQGMDHISAPTGVKAAQGRNAKAEPQHEGGEALAPAKTARGRPKRGAVDASVPEPAKPTRGRPRKIEVPKEEIVVVEEAPTRATRTRAGTLTKATAPKKTVKFEEPDKENMVPAPAKGKPRDADIGTGFRARPVRKPAAPATRATRGQAQSIDKTESSSPLSPKKVTQVGAVVKEATSDDELATSQTTTMKPLMKSPVKPPGAMFPTANKLDFPSSNSITVNLMASQDLGGSVMASPARRPAQSPFKESMKTSPQRSNFTGSMLESPLKPQLPAPKSVPQNTPFKASLLQSPARRPASPIKVNDAGSPSRGNKQPMIGVTPKAAPFKISRFATPRTVNTRNPSRMVQMAPPSAPPKFSMEGPKPAQAGADLFMTAEPPLQFTGRLSSVMPRETDPSFVSSKPVVNEIEQSDLDSAEVDDQMDVENLDNIFVEEPMDAQNTTPPASPPRNDTGSFGLRDVDENPFQDSDSEDELASSPKSSPVTLSGFNVSAHDFASSPMPFKSISTPKPAKSQRLSMAARSGNKEKVGFTPLAVQLSNWMAGSPEKTSHEAEAVSPIAVSKSFDILATETKPDPSPAKSTFFEDEMSVRDDMAAVPDLEIANEETFDEIEQEFGPVLLDDEDLALAEEADEMSLLETNQFESDTEERCFELVEPELALHESGEFTFPDQVEAMPGVVAELEKPAEASESDQGLETELVEDIEQLETDGFATHEQLLETECEAGTSDMLALSEASQEYGDENAIPIDPILLLPTPPHVPDAPRATEYATPKRVLTERTFHTVSKVPLKAAATEYNSMKASPMKRSASIGRLPAQRPTSNLTRSNTVISYSPSKKTPRSQKQSADVESQDSPSKAQLSTVGTPARTPRRNLDTALLSGAIVFVDVHTTEGADAGVLFTELLTEMGARCVKSWNWNGNGEDGSRIGITHVVFKDGGKRTLEKVRESDGVVCCVGVGWVLDCERENRWVEESPYTVDTAIIPRGGGRRRKSMEPRALANLNGTLVSSCTTPRKTSSEYRSPSKESLGTGSPSTSKSRRRDSVLWVRSPASSSSSGMNNEEEMMLTPVPATPAPEIIQAYADEGMYGDMTPAQTPYFMKKDQLVQKTAPVKRFFEDGDEEEENKRPGLGWLSEKKDESVMMRLMAARRKSLQWAPKVGSPLARGEAWN